MRIISGSARGLRLVAPKGLATRPTADRVRESLFSILGPLDGAVVVDAFAGSGALGIEALSRGAGLCHFFDPSRAAVEAIEENLEHTKLAANARVWACTFAAGLTRHIQEQVDLWLLDPPYAQSLGAEALVLLSSSPWVTQDSLVVLEDSAECRAPDVPGFALEDERRYGRARLMFFRRL